MKILLFGKNGQVGWELNRSLLPQGELVALGRDEADFSKPESIRKVVQELKPDIIINAVAYTAVDRAEEEEQLAHSINADTPGVLAETARKMGALLVHYSTDYVFDGSKVEPYVETDEPCPVNAYGRTKLAGELAIQASGCDFLIFRTSWVYAARAHNFMRTILRLAQEREELSIVDDQIGAPTSARLIADATALCLHQVCQEKATGDFESGLYHLTAAGETSWYGFAKKIVQIAKGHRLRALKIKKIKPIATSDYPTPAKRPLNSRLEIFRLESAFGMSLPDWETPLMVCIYEGLRSKF